MSCKFCESYDFGYVSAKVESDGHTSIVFAGGYSKFPILKRFKYCPMCGSRIRYTDNTLPDGIDPYSVIIDDYMFDKIENFDKYEKFMEDELYSIRDYIVAIMSSSSNEYKWYYDRYLHIISSEYGVRLEIDTKTNEVIDLCHA